MFAQKAILPENSKYFARISKGRLHSQSSKQYAHMLLFFTCIQALIPGSPEILKILLESGANPNVQDPPDPDTGKRTPLHNALHHGNEENATMLMRYGADVTVEDAWGNTPLHLAAKHSSLQVSLEHFLVYVTSTLNFECKKLT